MKKVLFHNADRHLQVKDKAGIKELVRIIFIQEQQELQRLDIVFCSDDYLLNINQRFLQHDYFTDVITFDLSENSAIIGEIYISLDRVKENSINEKTTFKRELLRVIFHGALHLCGFKDKKKAEKIKMRAKEDFYIQRYVSRDTVSL